MKTTTLYNITTHVWQLAMRKKTPTRRAQEDACSVSNKRHDAGNTPTAPQRREVTLFASQPDGSKHTGKEGMVRVISGHVVARERRFNPLIGTVTLEGDANEYTIESPPQSDAASHGTLLQNAKQAWFFNYTGCRPHIDYIAAYSCTDLLAVDTNHRFGWGGSFELKVDTVSPQSRKAVFIN